MKEIVNEKAWAIYHKKLDDIGNEIFSTKKKAHDFLVESAYHRSYRVMNEVLKNYKIVRITISYKV